MVQLSKEEVVQIAQEYITASNNAKNIGAKAKLYGAGYNLAQMNVCDFLNVFDENEITVKRLNSDEYPFEFVYTDTQNNTTIIALVHTEDDYRIELALKLERSEHIGD